MKASELILNPDGSVYHLNLLPKDIAPFVITVGDPERVRSIAKHMHKIEGEKHKREFLTLTGHYKDLRLSLISTGIGTDNIDIVFNELDALWNIDLKKRRIKDRHTPAKLLRLGTTGSLQEDIGVDQLIFSRYALGTDGLMEFYLQEKTQNLRKLEQRYNLFAQNNQPLPSYVYGAESTESILPYIPADMVQGITLTAKGFYAPQGRNLGRIPAAMPALVERMSGFSFENYQLTNMEMETAGILGLGAGLGHQAASISVALANRKTGEFSADAPKAIDHLIEVGLEIMYQWAQE